MMSLTTPSGSFRGEYAGTLFLIPYYVATYHILGEPLPADIRDGFIRYLWSQQHDDGGFGLDIESPSYVVSSVTNYVGLRLMGVPADDPRMVRCREWFIPRGGALTASSWGKFLLTILGLYDYKGLNPLIPEMWLLPSRLPLHPSNYWVHCRIVYLPMSYLYAKRFVTPLTSVLASVRDEIYPTLYADVDWDDARGAVATSDSYAHYSTTLKWSFKLLSKLEPFHIPKLRAKAVDMVLEHIRVEDESSDYSCVGPLNKVLNAIVWHHEEGAQSERVKKHIARMPDYLWYGHDGVKVKSYYSSEVWDTAFAVQAIDAAGALEQHRKQLIGAQTFLEAEQVQHDVPNGAQYYRNPQRGGWGFGHGKQGWPVTDCTAEALKALDIMAPLNLEAPQLPDDRLEAGVDWILAMQNPEGGFPTYEKTRGPRWLELFNPSDFFAEIMIDYSYIECTSSCMQALARYLQRSDLTHERRAEIERSMARAAKYLLRVQREDGSWEGFWGVCFTYGTWFAIEGLRAAGYDTSHPAIRRGAAFLRSKQRADGGWSESIESSRQRRYVEAETSQTVQTSWGILGLVAAGEGDTQAVRRAMQNLCAKQRGDGGWDKEHVAGVTNRNCAIDYVSYWSIFPVWALAAARGAQGHA